MNEKLQCPEGHPYRTLYVTQSVMCRSTVTAAVVYGDGQSKTCDDPERYFFCCRNRIRQYPALVNCTTIDWFSEWPQEALLEVAERYLEGVELGSMEGVSRLHM